MDISQICSEHLHENDFESDLRAQLMGTTSRRRLKPGAIPSINLRQKGYKTPDTLATIARQVRQLSKTKMKDHKEIISSIEHQLSQIVEQEHDGVDSSSAQPMIVEDLPPVSLLWIIDPQPPKNCEAEDPRLEFDRRLEDISTNFERKLKVKDEKLETRSKESEEALGKLEDTRKELFKSAGTTFLYQKTILKESTENVVWQKKGFLDPSRDFKCDHSPLFVSTNVCLCQDYYGHSASWIVNIAKMVFKNRYAKWYFGTCSAYVEN